MTKVQRYDRRRPNEFNINLSTLAQKLNHRLGLRLIVPKMSALIANLYKLPKTDLATLWHKLSRSAPDIEGMNKMLKRVRLEIRPEGNGHVLFDITDEMKEITAPQTPEEAAEADFERYWEKVKHMSCPIAPDFFRFSETHRTELALRYLKKHAGFVVRRIDQFGITDEYTRYGVLEECSEHHTGAKEILRSLKNGLVIADEEIRTRIIVNCVKHGEAEEVEASFRELNIASEKSRTDVLEQILITLSKLDALKPVVLGLWGITSPDCITRIVRAFLRFEQPANNKFSNIRWTAVAAAALMLDRLPVGSDAAKDRLSAECIHRFLQLSIEKQLAVRIPDLEEEENASCLRYVDMIASRIPDAAIEDSKIGLRELHSVVVSDNVHASGHAATLINLVINVLRRKSREAV